jgi:hypothetical protein
MEPAINNPLDAFSGQIQAVSRTNATTRPGANRTPFLGGRLGKTYKVNNLNRMS